MSYKSGVIGLVISKSFRKSRVETSVLWFSHWVDKRNLLDLIDPKIPFRSWK